MRQDGYIAATRFGMGIRPEEAGMVDETPKQWLLGQIKNPEAPSPYFNGFASTQQNVLMNRDASMRAKEAGDKAIAQMARKDLGQIHKEEIIAKAMHAATTATPFYERLVDFWANHFTVSVKKNDILGYAASFEREAIRPRVTGNFVDMLLAVESHPTMLYYLDNQQSIGPNSPAGKKSKKGLNENLAREIMELHTLGVNGGYTQTDVTNFAKVITGWGLAGKEAEVQGVFAFAENRHEPGEQIIMGRRYAAAGVQQGAAVLSDLARHPATANHLATKLARHFIADEPPVMAVTKLAQAFLQSGGDLKSVYRVLIELPEAWSLAHPKIKSSYDFVVSVARLCGTEKIKPEWFYQSLQFLGDMPMTAISPAGFSDVARTIAGPEALIRRIEMAQRAGKSLVSPMGYRQLAELSIGPIMSPALRTLLQGDMPPQEGLAMLLGSPEFQRR